MPEISVYECDGPTCRNRVNTKDEEANHWMKVIVGTADNSYKENFIFCSYNCLEMYTHEVVSGQVSDEDRVFGRRQG